MISLVVTLPVLKKCKELFTYTRKDIDPDILDLVDTINEHPEICTRWSCQGHYKESTEVKGEQVVDVSTHLQFIVTDVGKQVIEKFFLLIIANNIRNCSENGIEMIYYPKLSHWNSIPMENYSLLDFPAVYINEHENSSVIPLMMLDFDRVVEKHLLDVYKDIFTLNFL